MRRQIQLWWLLITLAGLLGGCRNGTAPAASPPLPSTAVTGQEGKSMNTATVTTFRLTSTSFANGAPIPARYAGLGDNHSPELSWEGLPPGTQELALIVEDPDAAGGDFVHWIVYNIPTSVTSFDEGLPTETHPDERAGFMQGRNDTGRTGYHGPEPPPGKVHHYHFRLLALDKHLGLPANVDKAAFRQAVRGHIIAESEIVGTFQRK